MSIFNIFKKKLSVTTTAIPEGALSFHEDDFCQVELVAAENLPFLQAKLQSVNYFASQHQTENGYTNTYLRNNAPTPLLQKGIPAIQFEETLQLSGLIKAPAVCTGYGATDRVLCSNTVGYGQGYAAIYYNQQNGLVEHIWVTNHFIIDKDRLTDFLIQCGKKWNLLLVDWNEPIVIDICNKGEVEKYLNS